MKNFNLFDLPETLSQSLERLNFKTPTPIQIEAIPLALEGHDILGSAPTGTGKTAAFGIPLVAKLMSNDVGSALVLTPTRELALQVMKSLQNLIGNKSYIKQALLIGGESMSKQLQQLRRKTRVFVGTPGRINDHLTRGSLKLNDVKFLVLDETDRMLDMGFSVQIKNIEKYIPKKRQTLLFSATIPQSIAKLADYYLNKPKRIAIGLSSDPSKAIKQDIIHITETEKYQTLLKELKEREGTTIIFVKTKYGTEKLVKKLRKEQESTDFIHGGLQQNKRTKVMKAFRNDEFRILVATDIAARGLDIPQIEHIINYDLPQCPEDYIHRIGRTARAGEKGNSLCLITPTDKIKWNAIVRFLNPNKSSSKSNRTKTHKGTKNKKFRFKRHSRNKKQKSLINKEAA